ncbi:MAG: cysteine--tRNA ligase [Promethearchaeota archaeon]
MKIFNSFTHKLETFVPLNEGKITFYSCGQTVNNVLHVGAARTYSQWDTIVKYLRWRGFDVVYIRNFTDVGHLTDDADQGKDKIIEKANERNLKPMELAETLIREFLRDTDALNIARPNIAPRATAHIPEMIAMIKTLIEKGYAYETERGIYFDTQRFPNYGKMANIGEITQLPGVRIAVDPFKRNSKDFALWIKAGPNHLLQWDSPWGKGYPGWSIECSVMAIKYLGETIDIHAGGMEHMMLHHPNERAQSEAATGKPFARYWIHAALVQLNKKKMAKSGKFISVQKLLQKYSGNLIRFYLVNSHYRAVVDFSEEQIENMRESFDKLMTTIITLRSFLKTTNFKSDELSNQGKQFKQEFISSMDNDFNVAEAWRVIHDLTNHLNVKTKEGATAHCAADFQLFLDLLAIMGIKAPPKEMDSFKLIESFIDFRNHLRAGKNFELADKIRDILLNSGIILEDKSFGTIYRLKKW